MNLRGIANRATRAVNPNIAATARICTGYTTNAAGKRAPQYADSVPVTIQAQALSKKEIEHLDALNLSNATRGVYANLQLTAADRGASSGGDMLTFEGRNWMVIAVLEGWTTAGWCKVAVGKQL